MVLANEEVIMREWEYATSTKGTDTTTHTLTVTNKRIVSESVGHRKTDRQEISTKDVKGFSITRTIGSKLGAVLCILLGVLFAILAFVMFGGEELVGMGVFVLIIAIVLVVVGIYAFLHPKISFNLVITTRNVEVASMRLGVYVPISMRSLFAKKTKIKVNSDIVEDIINTLGSLILD